MNTNRMLLVRKQVMKRAAIERKKRNKDKRVNLGQSVQTPYTCKK